MFASISLHRVVCTIRKMENFIMLLMGTQAHVGTYIYGCNNINAIDVKCGSNFSVGNKLSWFVGYLLKPNVISAFWNKEPSLNYYWNGSKHSL